jgi:hypothetical protein
MKEGDRVRLIHTDDPSGLRPGSYGRIVRISEMSADDVAGDPSLSFLLGRKKVWVNWDSGEVLALIEGHDSFRVIPKEEGG